MNNITNHDGAATINPASFPAPLSGTYGASVIRRLIRLFRKAQPAAPARPTDTIPATAFSFASPTAAQFPAGTGEDHDDPEYEYFTIVNGDALINLRMKRCTPKGRR